MKRRRRFSLHVCTPWGCGYGSSIWRLNIALPWIWVGVALEPGSRFVEPTRWIDVRRWPDPE